MILNWYKFITPDYIDPGNEKKKNVFEYKLRHYINNNFSLIVLLKCVFTIVDNNLKKFLTLNWCY